MKTKITRPKHGGGKGKFEFPVILSGREGKAGGKSKRERREGKTGEKERLVRWKQGHAGVVALKIPAPGFLPQRTQSADTEATEARPAEWEVCREWQGVGHLT
jgi:hypothetical protein